MQIQTGINLSDVYKIDDGPVEILATYQKLDVPDQNGCISSPIRTANLVMTLEVAEALIKSARLWIGSIISVQKLNVTDKPDHPYELTVHVSAPGMNYNIEMETLDQTIVWDSAAGEAGEFTMLARQAFDISLEAYIYYLDTLEDLINAINNLP